MKLTIATTGILFQALPAISDKEISTSLLPTDNKVDQQQQEQQHSAQHPTSAKHHRRHLFNQRHRRHNQERLQNNNNFVTTTLKGCDPTSKDPDVGILSCDVGQECIVDQTSELGGLCTLTTIRTLQASTCSLCGPGSYIDTEKSDVFVNGVDGTTCEQIAYATYYEGENTTILDGNICASSANLVREAGCCRAECNMCGDLEFYPDTLFPMSDGSLIPCDNIQSDLNSSTCDYYAYYYASHCCAPDIEGSFPPTISPADPTETSSPTTTPGSSSSSSATSTTTTIWYHDTTTTTIVMMKTTASFMAIACLTISMIQIM